MDKQITNQLWILLPPKRFKKLYLIFLNIKLNKNKLKINKWEMEINKLMEYKYKNNIWIADIIKAV